MIFDCSGPAELFMQKRKGAPRQPLRYRWVYHRGRRLVMNASTAMNSNARTRAAATRFTRRVLD